MNDSNPVTPLPSVDFLGLNLFSGSEAEFTREVIAIAEARARHFRIAYLNAATVNLAFDDARMREALPKMDCLYADGQAVVWGARRLGSPIAGRVNAGDFMEDFLREAAARGLRIALLGGRGGEAEGFAEYFEDKIDGLQIVFKHHGFIEAEDLDGVEARLIEADPHVVLIGMGSPLQEETALRLSRSGPARVWWCVGALFEYFAGTRRRAPIWMRRAGLEWLFRLALEPRRLGRRYLIGNPKFIARIWRRRSIL